MIIRKSLNNFFLQLLIFLSFSDVFLASWIIKRIKIFANWEIKVDLFSIWYNHCQNNIFLSVSTWLSPYKDYKNNFIKQWHFRWHQILILFNKVYFLKT